MSDQIKEAQVDIEVECPDCKKPKWWIYGLWFVAGIVIGLIF